MSLLLPPCLFVLALVPLETKEPPKDQPKLEGVWECAGIAGGPDVKFVFKGDTLRTTVGGDEREFKFTTDAGARPAALDLLALDNNYKGQTARGIYSVDGDTLRIVAPNDPSTKERPKEFAAPAGSGLIFLTLKRVKP